VPWKSGASAPRQAPKKQPGFSPREQSKSASKIRSD